MYQVCGGDVAGGGAGATVGAKGGCSLAALELSRHRTGCRLTVPDDNHTVIFCRCAFGMYREQTNKREVTTALGTGLHLKAVQLQ